MCPGRTLVLVIAILELLYFGSSLLRPQYLTTRASPVKSAFVEDRTNVIGRLAQDPNRHLVFVRYGSGHSFHREWVYNRADIDAAQIVWARDMGSYENRKLLEYYSDRRTWLLTATGASEGSPGSVRETLSLESYIGRADDVYER